MDETIVNKGQEIPPEMENMAEPPQESSPQTGELAAIIERFSPGADTSTPESTNQSALQVLNMMVPIYDKLYDVALANPEAASFVSDLLDTGSPVKALVRNFDTEEIQAALDEAENGDNEEDKAMFTDKVSQMKQRSEMVQKNMDISFSAVSEFMEERKDWPMEKAEAFEAFVIKFYDEGKDGLISKDALALLEKGFIHDDVVAAKDADIAEAETNGKIMGRNEKIVTEKASKNNAALLPEATPGMKPSAPVKRSLIQPKQEFRV